MCAFSGFSGRCTLLLFFFSVSFFFQNLFFSLSPRYTCTFVYHKLLLWPYPKYSQLGVCVSIWYCLWICVLYTHNTQSTSNYTSIRSVARFQCIWNVSNVWAVSARVSVIFQINAEFVMLFFNNETKKNSNSIFCF